MKNIGRLIIHQRVQIAHGPSKRCSSRTDDKDVAGCLDAFGNGGNRQAHDEENTADDRGDEADWTHDNDIGNHHGRIRPCFGAGRVRRCETKSEQAKKGNELRFHLPSQYAQLRPVVQTILTNWRAPLSSKA
jgi:hypothetical protein